MTIFSTSLLEWSSLYLSCLLSQAVSPTLSVLSQSLHLKSQSKIFKYHLLYVAFSGSSSVDLEGNRLFLPGNVMAFPSTHTSAIAFFIFYLIYAPLSSPLDSETPHKSDKLPWCNIKWLNFGAIVNWDFFLFFFFLLRLVLVCFGQFWLLFTCYSISTHDLMILDKFLNLNEILVQNGEDNVYL